MRRHLVEEIMRTEIACSTCHELSGDIVDATHIEFGTGPNGCGSSFRCIDHASDDAVAVDDYIAQHKAEA